MIQKGIFRVCFSIILREKSEQDTLESKTLLTHHHPPPSPSEHVQKFIRFGVGMLPLPFPIFKRPGVFIYCRTVSLHQAGDLTCWIAIFQIWGGKWLKCRQCSLFSDKGLVLKVLGPINPRIWSWDIVFDSRDHYFWYSRTQGFSKIYHMYGF